MPFKAKKCTECIKTKKQLQKSTQNDEPICTKCNVCIKCVKKVKKICKTCCNMCKKCSKIQIKNNWPIDIIIDGYCKKCYRMCNGCNKDLDKSKSFYLQKTYDKNNDKLYNVQCGKKFCEKCFNDFKPKDETKKYKAIFATKDDGKHLLRWDIIEERKLCQSCDKTVWFNYGKPMCKNCYKRKRTQKNKNDLFKQDPSDESKKYQYDKQQKKWSLTHNRHKCFTCLSSMWIKSGNEQYANKTFGFNCQNCRPEIKNLKFKYDKNIQNWIPYKYRINCQSCDKQKWLNKKALICVSCCNNNEKINQDNKTKKLIKI